MLAITPDGYNIWYSPSCSATFISITINHSSLPENMKGCNLNFSQRFSRKKEHYSLSTVSIPRYCLVNWWISSIYQDWTAGSRSETPRGKFVKIANHDLWAVKHQAGLMFSTLLQTLLNLLVVTSDLAGPCQTRSIVNKGVLGYSHSVDTKTSTGPVLLMIFSVQNQLD